MQQSAGYFTDMQPGGPVDLDYSPALGTRLGINGRLLATLTRAAFYRGVFKAWLGNEPTQLSLRQCLLERSATHS